MVHKRMTELSLIFVGVGMVFLVPVITGQALAETRALVEAELMKSSLPPMRDNFRPNIVEKRLDEGKWVSVPWCGIAIKSNTNVCGWTTQGTGVFGGAEAGHVILSYDYWGEKAPVAKVLFRWYNPRSGTNTCGAVVMERLDGKRVDAICSITQGNTAEAKYKVYYYAS